MESPGESPKECRAKQHLNPEMGLAWLPPRPATSSPLGLMSERGRSPAGGWTAIEM